MKFSVKFAEIGTVLHIARDPWWEEFDHPNVKDNRDAFAYGKVICEYWNSDLRPDELPRKVLNARVTGKGSVSRRIVPRVDRNQLDLFHHRKVQ